MKLINVVLLTLLLSSITFASVYHLPDVSVRNVTGIPGKFWNLNGSTLIPSLVPYSGATSNVNLNGKELQNISPPTLSTSAAQLATVTAANNTHLALSGGTLSGNVSMGYNRITSLANGSNLYDAINLWQLSLGLADKITGPSLVANTSLVAFYGTNGKVSYDSGLSVANAADAITKKHSAYVLGTRTVSEIGISTGKVLTATANGLDYETPGAMTKTTGTSTGTGTWQAIAHGEGGLPEIGEVTYTESGGVPASVYVDATYIHVSATSGITYEWACLRW